MDDPPILSHFPIVATSSLEEARDAVTRVYLPHDLRSDSKKLAMKLNAAQHQRFTLGFLAYGAPAEQRMPPTGTTYHINITTNGKTFAVRGDGARAVTHGQSSGSVLLPDQHNMVRWSVDAQQLILKVPRSRLESHLAELIGRPVAAPIDFDFGFDMTTPCGRSLLASVEFLARELNRPGGISENPLTREQLEAFVMTQVLMAVPNSYSGQLTAPAPKARAMRLRPVLDYMDRKADQPLTPQDLARVGSMSVRTLHATFQHELGMSPMAYLRGIRLNHVHADLLRYTGSDGRISDIAMRWGFYHPSRFARQYQAKFGELPSETLRRYAR